MPLAPLEAAGAGLPTILSDIEGHQFLKSWATYFDPHKPEEGSQKIIEVLDAVDRMGDKLYFQDRWTRATPLREKWGVQAMSSSYEEAFESL